MKILSVRFGDSQKLKIDDIANSLGMTSSDIARSAMFLGLQQIMALGSAEVEKAQELVAISNFRAK